jgi:glycosyltransferase involved in cell wall biosynthesis
VNKENNTVRRLLDVACEQTCAHVLLRGLISFCAESSSAYLIGGGDAEINDTLSLFGITGRSDAAGDAELVVISQVISSATELRAQLVDLQKATSGKQFVYMRVAASVDRSVVHALLDEKRQAVLRYRTVKGGVAAVWIGPASDFKRAPKANMIGAKIVVLSDRPGSTLTRIRLGVPLQFLADELNINLVFRSFAAFDFSELRGTDFFIAQRGAHRRAYSILDIINRVGGAYVCEIDDLLTEIPDFLGHHSGLIENKNIITGLISRAALVTCTQEKLRQQMLRFNKQARICGNYGDPYLLPRYQARQDTGGGSIVTILIAASDRILVHFLMDALARILKAHPERVKLVVVGPIGDEFRKCGVDARYVDIIPHLEFTDFASGLENPIGVIPLDDSEFSSCKSAVKYFDYSVAGLVTVCSNVTPYKDVIVNGVNGVLVANTTEAWFDALNALVVDGALRADIAHRAAKHVRELHGLDVVMTQWYDVIDTMLLRVRVPAPVMSGLEKIKFKFMCFLLALRSINHRRIEMRRAAKADNGVVT